MSARRGPDQAPGAPVVLISVEPPLLATTLGRLLAARGWAVDDLHGFQGRADAVVVSEVAADDADLVDAPVVIVLSDDGHGGGTVHHADGHQEPLAGGRRPLEALFEALAGRH